MEELNRQCGYVIETYISDDQQLYSFELKERMKKQSKIYKKEIDETIDENILNEGLKNPVEYYNVLLYLIIYENELTQKYKKEIINSILNNMKNELFNPILHILMMNSELDDEIVKKIIDITNPEYLEKHYFKLGNKPFDYRYHILRRREISIELKSEILKRYEFERGYDVDDDERQIYYDIEFELKSKNIQSKEEIEKDNVLADEVRAYQLIKKYKSNMNKD